MATVARNRALDAIGKPELQLGSITDGTLAGRTSRRIYGTTLRELLRTSHWAFARKKAPLQLLGGITATSTVSLNILGGSGWTVGGVYPLAKYTSAYIGNGFSAFALGTLPLRVSGTLSNDTANSQIDFVVTAITEPLNWAAGAGNWARKVSSWKPHSLTSWPMPGSNRYSP